MGCQSQVWKTWRPQTSPHLLARVQDLDQQVAVAPRLSVRGLLLPRRHITGLSAHVERAVGRPRVAVVVKLQVRQAREEAQGQQKPPRRVVLDPVEAEVQLSERAGVREAGSGGRCRGRRGGGGAPTLLSHRRAVDEVQERYVVPHMVLEHRRGWGGRQGSAKGGSG
jgi:hypothetical protein